MGSKKLACGLCGKTKDLTKTPCCDQWICDDEHKYVLFSYATNSCYRNHDRYTLCASHHREGHQGKWPSCQRCKDEYPVENYADFGTNDFNFEKLPNPPEISITCVHCGFKSGTVQDFACQTSRGWFCGKEECQKAAMVF
jgi:hypothetical protein